jgi:hypothetical protein
LFAFLTSIQSGNLFGTYSLLRPHQRTANTASGSSGETDSVRSSGPNSRYNPLYSGLAPSKPWNLHKVTTGPLRRVRHR